MKRLDGPLSVDLPEHIGAGLLLKLAVELGLWGSGFGGRPEGRRGDLIWFNSCLLWLGPLDCLP